MSEAEKRVKVQVKFGDVEQTFEGSVEDVWLSVNRFFGEFVPSFEVAQRLLLMVDLQKVVKECEGIIVFSKEGPNLLVPRNKLTDNETLGLWLLAYHVGHDLGLLQDETIGKDELQMKLGKDAKITGTRLGELVKNGIVAKVADEKYRITVFGVSQMQKDILPKIKVKADG
jgi:hypothetical protein